jgi:trehalose utilization protein
VLQVTFERNGHNFHIVVWVGAKAHPPLDDIVVEYAQSAKMKSIGLVPIRKTKTVTSF